MKHPGGLLALAAWLCLAACASTPSVPVAPGSRVLVSLDDGRGLRLELANASHPDLADVYSERRDSASLKLAPDQLMGELLASLERNGLAEFGVLGGSTPAQGGALVVEHDDQRRVFAKPPSGDVEAQRAWVRFTLTMDHYYQHVGALQYVANPEGRGVFERGNRP